MQLRLMLSSQPAGNKRSQAKFPPPPPPLAGFPSPRHPRLSRGWPLPGVRFHSDLKGTRLVSRPRWSPSNRPRRPPHPPLAARRPALHPPPPIFSSCNRAHPRSQKISVQAQLLHAGECSQLQHNRREAWRNAEEELQHKQEPSQPGLLQVADGGTQSQPGADSRQPRLFSVPTWITSLPCGRHTDPPKVEALPGSSRCDHHRHLIDRKVLSFQGHFLRDLPGEQQTPFVAVEVLRV